MKLKTMVVVVAVPVVAVGVAVVAWRRNRKKKKSKRDEHAFMPENMRANIEDLLSLESSDLISNGHGASLYQRKLENLSDGQLLALFALFEVSRVMRERGVDLSKKPTKEDVKQSLVEFKKISSKEHGRKEMLKQLGEVGFESLRMMLMDSMALVPANA